MNRNLEAQAYAWERRMGYVLDLHNVLVEPLSAADRVRAPQVLTYRLTLSDPRDLSQALRLSDEIALAMRVDAVRVGRTRGHVCVEVPLPRWARTKLYATNLPVKEGDGHWISVGMTSEGIPVQVNLDGTRACHALVAGQTGSGKSTAMQLLAWTTAARMDPARARMIIVDGKASAMDDGENPWRWFHHVPHLLHPVVRHPEEAAQVFMWLAAELVRRKERGVREPTITVIVDELSELLQVAGGVVPEVVAQLTKTGRSFGIRVIVGTQHPLVGELGGSVTKANLPLRLVGQVTDSSTAYTATRVKGSGAEALQGRGDFLITVDGKQVHRVQVAMPRDTDLAHLERVEDVSRLNLDEIPLETVPDLTPRGKLPVEPEQVAIAVARQKATGSVGIQWLARKLRIGATRAKRVQQYTERFIVKLTEAGYIVSPV